jgi:hypothetical protein
VTIQQNLTPSQTDAVVRYFGSRALVHKANKVIDQVSDLIASRPQSPVVRKMRLTPMLKAKMADHQALKACKSSMEKAFGHLRKAAERYPDDDNLDKGNTHLAAGLFQMSKIDFEDRTPEGSGLEDIDMTNAGEQPAKAALTRELTKHANEIMSEVKRQSAVAAIDKSDRRAMGTLLPTRPFFKAIDATRQDPHPIIPGHALDPTDAGGALDDARKLKDPRAALNAALAAIQSKPQVLATPT